MKSCRLLINDDRFLVYLSLFPARKHEESQLKFKGFVCSFPSLNQTVSDYFPEEIHKAPITSCG